jgi:hypothetical protein
MVIVIAYAIVVATSVLLASCSSDDEDWLGESPVSRAAIDAAQNLGCAVISYFNGELDLSVVEQLVAPSAEEDLAEMLSSLVRPTSCEVTKAVGRVSSSRREVVLRFVDAGRQEPIKFILTVDVQPDSTAIEAVKPGNAAG